ncbi:MAG: hypothetical protein ACI36V_03170 [Coriobacteriales bacterium]
MEFVQVAADDERAIEELSAFASHIVKEHFDPIIGPEQNDYMIAMNQSPCAIAQQLVQGSRYYLCMAGGRRAGFMAFHPKGAAMYLGLVVVFHAVICILRFFPCVVLEACGAVHHHR